ncbi:HPt domain-containing protein [Synechococcus sp. PCC 7502]|uniref:Hpt domain-containing protein n=1 Tax=Synechococcus sp. PCC 7502 TaxID=1173263 RepID=UPI00029FBB2D|nr:Hpt domain-containing protein [Synechococcus sp. PCC 7502]AFY74591.1 HPt domain-containing protein [Synechococcus sp. PCC 7502]
MSSNIPINLEYLNQISDGDEEFELELLNLFIEDAKQHLAVAEAAIKTQDFKTLEREAHHIKGSSGNVGAQTMQTVAYALEQQSLKQSLEEVPEKIESLKSYLQEIEVFVANR